MEVTPGANKPRMTWKGAVGSAGGLKSAVSRVGDKAQELPSFLAFLKRKYSQVTRDFFLLTNIKN